MSILNSRARLLCIVATLVGIGVVAIYSVSVGRVSHLEDSYRVLGKQVLWILIGSCGLVAAMKFGYKRMSHRGVACAFLGFAAMLLVSVLLFGTVCNGAKRWFRFGPFSFQPSEIAKLAIIVYMAEVISRRRGKLDSFWKNFLPPLLIMGILFGLVILQPDFGTAMVIAAVGGLMLLVGGARLSHACLVAGAAIPGIVYLVISSPYRIKRVFAFLDPWADARGAGYHLVQSLTALGLGHVRGKGIGASIQKLYFLPEAKTDFIFAIIGEEMGFIGCTFVILVFLLLIWEGIRIATRAPDMFGSMMAFGITLVLGLQAALNIAVVTASVPPKGITLPFISFGGSALLFCMTAVGFLADIAAAGDEHALRKKMAAMDTSPQHVIGAVGSHV
ncbi:MAG: putative lipid II flippase FtsW [Planctomycetes bacterium]|nr:putative lipid II flippase FtsW [Planctomycetota bacterium]